MEKFGGAHSTRRTAAIASLNVGSCFGRWTEQIGVQPQPRDHADMATHSSE
jgi:hypothetical protein